MAHLKTIAEANKAYWDELMEDKYPPVEGYDSNGCCVIEEDEDGNVRPATPINNDPDIKLYGALKEVIESNIKLKTYKCWHIGTELFESYAKFPEPINEFDVLFLFSKDWEEPLFHVLVKKIDEENKTITVQWLGGKDHEDPITKELKYK